MFRRVDAMEADSLGAARVHHADRVAVDNLDHSALELDARRGGKKHPLPDGQGSYGPQRTLTVREGIL